jgi:hypothetical protein
MCRTHHDDPNGLTPSAAALVQRVRTRLEPHGWKLMVSLPSPRSVYIALDHDLSSGRGIGFANAEPTDTAFVDEELAHREFMSIASCPTSLSNVRLLGDLRRAAHANGWSSDVLAVVARILRGHEVLTETEAHWLEDAGPAWYEQ